MSPETRSDSRMMGDVEAVGLDALLQMLGQQGTSGRLTLRQGGVVRRFDIADAYISAIRHGSGSVALHDPRHARIGELLVSRHQIRRETIERTLEIQREMVHRAAGRRRPLLGELLLARGEIGAAPLREALAEQLRSDVMDLVTRKDVTFEFRPGRAVSVSDVSRLPIMSVLMESARRVDDRRVRPMRRGPRVAVAVPMMQEARRIIDVLKRADVEAAAFNPDARSFLDLYAFLPTVVIADGDRGADETEVILRQAAVARAPVVFVMNRPGEDRIRWAARLGVRTIVVRPWTAQALLNRLLHGRTAAAA